MKIKLLSSLFFFFCTVLCAQVFGKTEFIGNKIYNDRELSYLIPYNEFDPFSYDKIEKLKRNIESFYLNNNYLYTKILAPKLTTTEDNAINVRITIVESTLDTIRDYKFIGNYAIKSQIFTSIFKQKSYFLNEIDILRKIILNEYSDRGYFFTNIFVDSISETSDGAVVTFKIKENKPFYHKKYEFNGNKVSKDYSLIKISGLSREKNKSVTIKDLQNAENRIKKKIYIKDCRVIPYDQNTILIDVVEDKMTTISGIAGYNSKSKDNPFTGYLDFSFFNLFGNDRNISFYWNKLQKDKSDLSLKYHDSGFKNYYFSSDYKIKRTEYDTLSNYTQIGVAINYDFLQQRFTVLGELSKYIVTAQNLLEDNESIKTIGIKWNKTTIDKSYNPTKGYEIDILYNYNSSSMNSKKYNIYDVQGKYILSLSNLFVIYNKVNIKYSTKKNLLNYSSFKLGGFKSLRGFQEEQFSGYFTFCNNLELRYQFGTKNNVFIFSDFGYLQNYDKTINRRNIIGNLYSLGLGLHIATKVGDLVFAYGIGYDNGWSSLYDGLIHFGLETSF